MEDDEEKFRERESYPFDSIAASTLASTRDLLRGPRLPIFSEIAARKDSDRDRYFTQQPPQLQPKSDGASGGGIFRMRLLG
jgi:hypothetical protein